MRLLTNTKTSLLATFAATAVLAGACQKNAETPQAGAPVVLKIASQKGGTRALMEVSHALEGAGYKVEWSEFPSAQTLLEALAAGSVDAWATWNPYVALATLHGDDRVLVDGRGLLHVVGFEAASQAAIQTKPTQLFDFLHRLAKAEQWESQHLDEFAVLLAKETGLPAGVTRVTVANQRPTVVPIDQAVISEERETLSHFQAAGLIDKAPAVDGAFDLEFNAAVQP